MYKFRVEKRRSNGFNKPRVVDISPIVRRERAAIQWKMTNVILYRRKIKRRKRISVYNSCP